MPLPGAPLGHSPHHHHSPRPAHSSVPLPQWSRRVGCPELLDPKLDLHQMWETQLPQPCPGPSVPGAKKEWLAWVRGWGWGLPRAILWKRGEHMDQAPLRGFS